MPNLLDVLGLGATAVTRARTARMEGEQERAATERQALLDRLKMEGEQQDREMRRRLTEAQIGNFESQAQERLMPSSSPGARAQYDPARGGWVLPPNENAPQGRFVVPEGMVERPEAPRVPVRGTPEYLKSVEDEARLRARVAAETGDRSAARPTESQEKSYMYGQFMRESLPVIDSLGPTVNGRAISLALGRAVQTGEDFLGPGSLTGDLLGESEQQLINAARVFAAGILRKESGAAITPAELRDTFQRFIPLGNDSPAVVAQKKRNRELAERVMGDLSLPAEEYYRRIRSVGTDAPPANIPQGATPSPAPQAVPSFDQWRAGRNP